MRLLLSSEWDEGEGEAHFRVEFVASDSYETNVTTMDTPAQNEECLLRWVNGRHDARGQVEGGRVV